MSKKDMVTIEITRSAAERYSKRSPLRVDYEDVVGACKKELVVTLDTDIREELVWRASKGRVMFVGKSGCQAMTLGYRDLLEYIQYLEANQKD